MKRQAENQNNRQYYTTRKKPAKPVAKTKTINDACY
jgi:hypothetical protein